jgi:putative isomerase
LAKELAEKTMGLFAIDIEKNGLVNEQCHPDTGEALSHKGFMNWNMLVMEMM